MSSAAEELHAAIEQADEVMLRLEHAVLNASAINHRSDVDLGSYALAIEHIKDYQSRCRVALAEATKALAMRVSRGEIVETSDGIPLERKDGAARKSWQHEQLRAVVAERVISSHTTDEGTLDAPVSVLIVEALKFPSISGWKVTALRDAGINPDSYCVKKDGTVSFSVVDSTSKNNEGTTDDDDFL